ncbi:MAG: hypothetical protein R3F59_17740 [Myxococcota bacterium]
MRDLIEPRPYFRFGLQTLRRGRTTVDADLTVSMARRIFMPGPWRTQMSGGAEVMALHEVSPWLALGPTLGTEYGVFVQQWTVIGGAWVPEVGVRANSMLIGARRWGFVLAASATVDLARVRFVRETAQVVTVSPFEAGLSARFLVGHGRDPRSEP